MDDTPKGHNEVNNTDVDPQKRIKISFPRPIYELIEGPIDRTLKDKLVILWNEFAVREGVAPGSAAAEKAIHNMDGSSKLKVSIPTKIRVPISTTRRIMKADDEVEQMISKDATIIMSKIVELFVLDLTVRAAHVTNEKDRKILKTGDIAAGANTSIMFDFLCDIFPEKEYSLARKMLNPLLRRDFNQQQQRKSDLTQLLSTSSSSSSSSSSSTIAFTANPPPPPLSTTTTTTAAAAAAAAAKTTTATATTSSTSSTSTTTSSFPQLESQLIPQLQKPRPHVMQKKERTEIRKREDAKKDASVKYLQQQQLSSLCDNPCFNSLSSLASRLLDQYTVNLSNSMAFDDPMPIYLELPNNVSVPIFMPTTREQQFQEEQQEQEQEQEQQQSDNFPVLWDQSHQIDYPYKFGIPNECPPPITDADIEEEENDLYSEGDDEDDEDYDDDDEEEEEEEDESSTSEGDDSNNDDDD